VGWQFGGMTDMQQQQKRRSASPQSYGVTSVPFLPNYWATYCSRDNFAVEKAEEDTAPLCLLTFWGSDFDVEEERGGAAAAGRECECSVSLSCILRLLLLLLFFFFLLFLFTFWYGEREEDDEMKAACFLLPSEDVFLVLRWRLRFSTNAALVSFILISFGRGGQCSLNKPRLNHIWLVGERKSMSNLGVRYLLESPCTLSTVVR